MSSMFSISCSESELVIREWIAIAQNKTVVEYAIQFESFEQLTHILTRSERLLTPYSVRQKTNTHIYCIYCSWYETRCLRCLLSPCVSDEAALYCTCSLWITNNAGKLQVKTFYIQISKTLFKKLKWLGACAPVFEKGMERFWTWLTVASSLGSQLVLISAVMTVWKQDRQN